MSLDGVCHRDIRWNNVIWTEEGWRLIDFELAGPADARIQLSGVRFTYMPQSVQNGGQFTKVCCVCTWCVCVIVNIYRGRDPEGCVCLSTAMRYVLI